MKSHNLLQRMTLLTLSASIQGLKPPCDNNNVCHPTGLQTRVFFTGLYLIALGTGGIKPFNVGALVASSVLVWIQSNVGWSWGFGIPAVAIALDVVSFFSGTQLYRNQILSGSPLTHICQVLVASFRKFCVRVPRDKSLLYETADEESVVKGSRKLDHTDQQSFLDKAAVETQSDKVKGSAL
ncbi:hypothetical protein ACFX13_009977 [Malus domestica]